MANDQTIQKFYTNVQQNDFARQFQFRVKKLANTGFDDNEHVYLETGVIPGRSITNVQVPFMGLQFNVPGTATYPGSDSWTVTFRCDQNYNLRSVLENATFITFNDQSSKGDYNIARSSQIIELALLDKDLSEIRTYTLYGAYVVSVGEMAYNLGDSGAIQTLQATLAYQFWRATSTEGSTWSQTIYNDTPESNGSPNYAAQFVSGALQGVG